MLKNSAIGPSASAGKKLRAPTKSTINISKNTNIAFVVDKVPDVVAILLFLARLPAMARVPIIGKNLAKSITRPNDTFRNIVFPLKPANAEPLLPPHDEYAYNISENPCAPELFKLSATPGTIAGNTTAQ